MCGICGVLFIDDRGTVNRHKLENAVASLQHRGPDDSGIFVDNNLGLGFRRLSIIDLSSAGHQPMFNEDKSLCIVFNGEIYNYLDIKKILLDKGHKFRSNSDTEVIIHSYEEWGENCLERLDGMFAFAIWNSKNRSLFLARDRFGIKPLYYYSDNRIFAFGSEIKAIMHLGEINKEINYSALSNYFSLMSVPVPQTAYKNISKLLPACAMKVNSNGERNIWKYWQLNVETDFSLTENDWIDNIRETFGKSVKKHLVSDVPVAVMLSGGVDSSSIVAYASKIMNEPIRTFSVSFRGENKYDESEYQRIVSKKYNTKHTEFVANLDILDTAEQLIRESDEPFAVYSALPLYLISKEISNHTKVVLTGDGGDEVFAGYDIRYKVLKLLEYFDHVPASLSKMMYYNLNKMYDSSFNYNVSRLRRFASYGQQSLDNRYLSFAFVFDDGQKEKIFYPDIYNSIENDTTEFYKKFYDDCPADGLSRYLHFDLLTSLTNEMLTKVDRCTSMASIEGRVPFLDKDLVELAFKIPVDFKVSQPKSFLGSMNSLNNKGGKLILKKAFEDVLPKEILYRPKAGFSVPLERWLSTYDLEGIAIEKDEYVNYEYFLRLVKAFRGGKTHLSNQLWVMINYYIWRHNTN